MDALLIMTGTLLGLETICILLISSRRHIFPIPYRFWVNVAQCLLSMAWQISFMFTQDSSTRVRCVNFILGCGMMTTFFLYHIWRMWVEGKIGQAIAGKMNSHLAVFHPDPAVQTPFDKWIARAWWAGTCGMYLFFFVGGTITAALIGLTFALCAIGEGWYCTYPPWVETEILTIICASCAILGISKTQQLREGLFLRAENLGRLWSNIPLGVCYLGLGLTNKWEYVDYANSAVVSLVVFWSTLFPWYISLRYKAPRGRRTVVAVDRETSTSTRRYVACGVVDGDLEFDSLFNDRDLLVEFGKYLQETFAGENLLFLKAHREFQALEVTTDNNYVLQGIANSIAFLFFLDNAELKISISHEALLNIKQGLARPLLDPTIFDMAEQEVSDILRQSAFIQFKGTPAYAALQATRGTRSVALRDRQHTTTSLLNSNNSDSTSASPTRAVSASNFPRALTETELVIMTPKAEAEPEAAEAEPEAEPLAPDSQGRNSRNRSRNKS